MATISNDNPVFTVIVRYTVSPADQPELVETLKRSSTAFKEVPGFISLNMHGALDGKQVLVYLQWRSQADSDACFSHPVWLEAGKELMTKFIQTGKVTMEPQPYEVVYSIEMS